MQKQQIKKTIFSKNKELLQRVSEEAVPSISSRIAKREHAKRESEGFERSKKCSNSSVYSMRIVKENKHTMFVPREKKWIFVIWVLID